MNKDTVEWDLGEALIDLRNLVAEFRSDKIETRDETELAVRLGHILDHICLAWNCKDITPEQKSKLSQEEFERLSNTVPNFLGQRVLGDYALS